jgi:hypothetical protein
VGGDTALALAATALVLFSLAYLSPMTAIDIDVRGQSVRLGSGIAGLFDHRFAPLALFVLGISIGIITFGKASDNNALSPVSRTVMAVFAASGVPRSRLMTAF